MASRGQMTCQYNEVIGPSWPLDEGAGDALWHAIDQTGWFGEAPDRSGFADVRRYEPLIFVGYFAVEKPITIVTYDEKKHMEEHEEESFEHVWFVLFLEEGRLLAQRRRFIHRDLNAADVVKRLETSLASTFGSVAIPVIDYQPFEHLVPKEEFLREFAVGGIIEIQIDSLYGRSVPDSVRLFNPDLDRDEVLKESYAEDNRQIEELTGKASTTGDLSKTRLFKAEIEAGEPRYIKREEESGTIVRQRVITDRLEFTVTQTDTRVIPTDEEIAEIVAAVKGLPRPRRRRAERPKDQESLFDDDEDL